MKQRIFTRDMLLILLSGFFYFASPMLATPLMGAACLGYASARSPLMVILSRIVNGIGFSCCSVCLSVWMASLLPKEKIGSGMGIYGTMNALAMAAAPALGVSLYEKIGCRAAFLIAAAFAGMILVIIQFVRDKGEPQPAPEAEAKSRGKRLRLADVRVLPVAAIIMLFAIPYCATQSFLVRYVETRELPVAVSLFFPAYASALLFLRVTLRRLFDRKPFSFFMFLSGACALAGILLLGAMDSNGLMFLAAAFMAGGYGIMCSVCQSKAILMAGKGRSGLANSTYYIGIDLGMSLGPMIGGVLYGNIDLRFFYPVLAVTVPVSLAVYWMNRRRLG